MIILSVSFLQTRYGSDLHDGVCGAMIGLSSYAGVMDNLKNSEDEEQKPKKEESSKNQKAKPVGGFVLVHAGKICNQNQQQRCDHIQKKH